VPCELHVCPDLHRVRHARRPSTASERPRRKWNSRRTLTSAITSSRALRSTPTHSAEVEERTNWKKLFRHRLSSLTTRRRKRPSCRTRRHFAQTHFHNKRLRVRESAPLRSPHGRSSPRWHYLPFGRTVLACAALPAWRQAPHRPGPHLHEPARLGGPRRPGGPEACGARASAPGARYRAPPARDSPRTRGNTRPP